MAIQIEKVILWRSGKGGESVEYDFVPGKLNIILGGHACGKTTFLKIIDYSLGGDTSHIDAHIEENLSWVGVILQASNARHLFARAVPNPGRVASPRCYHETFPLDVVYEIPTDLEANTTDDNVSKILTAIVCGRPATVSDGEKTPLPFSVPKSIALQGYATITNETRLFDNQDIKTVKKWLPFVLGIERPEQIELKLELENKKSLKANLTQESNIIKKVLSEWAEELQIKLGVARSMRLYMPKHPSQDVPKDLTNILTEANLLLSSTKGSLILPEIDGMAHEQSAAAIQRLMEETDEISYGIGILQRKLEQIEEMAATLQRFGDAAEKTSERLQIVRWLREKWEPNQMRFFNVCDEQTEQEAKNAFRTVLNALQSYEDTISNTSKRDYFNHQINERRQNLRAQIGAQQKRLAQKNEQIKRYCKEDRIIDDAIKLQQRAFDLIGEVKAIVRLAESTGGNDLENQISKLTQEIENLDVRYKNGVLEEAQRRQDYLESIANRTHELLQGLHVSQRQKSCTLVFDIAKVDLILKFAKGVTRLSKESASSYHIAFHVALTCAIVEHFVGHHGASGLGFVIYDEPSRSEDADAANKRSDEVGHAVYQTLIQSVAHSEYGWQPIVIDTATKDTACKGLSERDYHVIEFKAGEGILPKDWISDNEIKR